MALRPLTLRRRYRKGGITAPPTEVVLEVSTPSVTATGVLSSLYTTSLVIETPSVTATGVNVYSVYKLSVNTPSVSAVGVQSSAVRRNTVTVPEVTATGILPRAFLRVSIASPSVSATGVVASATRTYTINTPDVTATGVIASVFNLTDGEGSIGDLRLYYSGGNPVPSNYDSFRQYHSLGGEISTNSTSLVHSQTFTAATIAGVTIKESYGNLIGDTALYFISGTPNQYQWGTSDPVDIEGAGFFTLGDMSFGQLYVECDGTFPGASTDELITVGRDRHQMFDIVSPLQSYFGWTAYRCFYIKNTSTGRARDAYVWMDSQPAVGTTYRLGLDPAGIGDGSISGVATTIENGEAIPAGVTFSLATLGSALSIGTMYPGDTTAVWVERTVNPEITELIFFNEADIAIGALI